MLLCRLDDRSKLTKSVAVLVSLSLSAQPQPTAGHRPFPKSVSMILYYQSLPTYVQLIIILSSFMSEATFVDSLSLLYFYGYYIGGTVTNNHAILV